MKKFLLIDDHAVVRRGVEYMLREFYSPCEIDEAEDEEQVVEKIKSGKYDLIFLDINIPETNTLELLKYILIKDAEAMVVMFSMNAEKIHARRYLKAGAKGFLSKDAPVEEIKRAINLILNKRNYYSETLIDSLLHDKNGQRKTNPFENLSEREFQIANLLLEGKALTEIATLLNIHTSTAGTHKAKILVKLNVNNIVELIELAKMYS